MKKLFALILVTASLVAVGCDNRDGGTGGSSGMGGAPSGGGSSGGGTGGGSSGGGTSGGGTTDGGAGGER